MRHVKVEQLYLFQSIQNKTLLFIRKDTESNCYIGTPAILRNFIEVFLSIMPCKLQLIKYLAESYRSQRNCTVCNTDCTDSVSSKYSRI